MADSTGLAQSYSADVVAKVMRCYLNAATRIIRYRGGKIRSFDGDRVMGIFIGDSKNSSAAKAALNVSWAVEQVIRPKLKGKWANFNWTMRHGIGIDTGEAMLVRGGVHGQNDIISIGSAPNVAAKLSELRTGYSIYISDGVYSKLNEESKLSDGKDMWSYGGKESFGGKSVAYYGSNYRWRP